MFVNYKTNTSFLIGALIGLILGGFAYPVNTIAQESRVGVVYYCVDTIGFNGAANLSNTLVGDGRFGSVTLVDGAVERPGTQDLLSRFDCVISMISDSFCDNPDELREEAGQALAGYAKAGSGLVISTFGFSTGLGFGPALFEPGLSPFQKVQDNNGPAGPVNIAGAADSPPACARMLSGVGPFSSTFSNFVGLSDGASLCASSDNGEFLIGQRAWQCKRTEYLPDYPNGPRGY